MRMKKRLILTATALLLNGAFAQNFSYPPDIEGTTERVYKSVDGIDLKIWIFEPGEASEDHPPAVMFFFGGGWNKGSPKQFVRQCQYLADRGMYGILADYRVASRHGVKAGICVEDARDAFRYLCEHAEEIGIDPNRIGAGGASAGGHLAACLGTLYSNKSYAPKLLALYNPATILAPMTLSGETGKAPDEMVMNLNLRLKLMQGNLKRRFGAPPETFSPWHHITDKTPPTIIFHGTKDQTVPFETAYLFEQKLKAMNITVELKAYEGKDHGFFNQIDLLKKTNDELDSFLVSQGWLSPM